MFTMIWNLVKWIWNIFIDFASGMFSNLPEWAYQLVVIAIIWIVCFLIQFIIDKGIKLFKQGEEFFEK